MILPGILLLAAHGGGYQAANWRTVTLAPHVTVSIPESAAPLPDVGKNLPNGKALFFTDDLGSFEAGVFNSTPEEAKSPDRALANFLAGQMHTAPGIVKRQRDLLYHGWPGLEDLIVTDQGIVAYSKAYMIDGKLFVVERGYRQELGRPEDTQRFIDSLNIESCPEGPLKTPGPIFTTFTSPEGGFQVGMPSAVEQDKKDIDSEGVKATAFRYRTQYGNRIYTAAFALFAKGSSGGNGEDFATGILGGLKAKVVSRANLTRDGRQYNSVGFTVKDGQMGGRLDTTQDGNRVISVLMAYPLGHAGSPDIEAFFNSLKVSPK